MSGARKSKTRVRIDKSSSSDPRRRGRKANRGSEVAKHAIQPRVSHNSEINKSIRPLFGVVSLLQSVLQRADVRGSVWSGIPGEPVYR